MGVLSTLILTTAIAGNSKDNVPSPLKGALPLISAAVT